MSETWKTVAIIGGVMMSFPINAVLVGINLTVRLCIVNFAIAMGYFLSMGIGWLILGGSPQAALIGLMGAFGFMAYGAGFIWVYSDSEREGLLEAWARKKYLKP